VRFRPALRGFTLIELLVVLAILGILTTTVALTVSTDSRNKATADIKELSLLLEAAMTEAQAGRRQLAWSADAGGYEFWETENTSEYQRRWRPLTTDERFRSHRFAAGLQLVRLDIDGQTVPQGALLVFRRGDPPLFRIALETRHEQSGTAGIVELRGLPTGRVDILSRAEP